MPLFSRQLATDFGLLPTVDRSQRHKFFEPTCFQQISRDERGVNLSCPADIAVVNDPPFVGAPRRVRVRPLRTVNGIHLRFHPRKCPIFLASALKVFLRRIASLLPLSSLTRRLRVAKGSPLTCLNFHEQNADVRMVGVANDEVARFVGCNVPCVKVGDGDDA